MKLNCQYKILNICIILLSTVIFLAPIKNDSEYYFKKAKIQYENLMYDYAMYNLKYCLMVNNKYYKACNLLAKIYLKKNEKYKALEYFLKSVNINNNQPYIHYEIAQLYYFYVEYDKALKHLNISIKQNPDLIQTYYLKVLIFNFYKQYKKSQSIIDIVNKKIGKLTDKQIEEANKLYLNGKINSAIEKLKDILNYNPLSKRVYIELATIYRHQNQIKKAINILEKCFKIYPYDNKVILTLAYLYIEDKDTKKRLFNINRAKYLCNILVKQNDCAAILLLYDIYKYLGDKTKIGELQSKVVNCMRN